MEIMKISISFLLLFSIPLLSCAQLKSNKVADISGKYNYVATDSLSGMTLNINKDGSFSYSVETDVSTMHTSGRWSLIKDTLIINSSIDQKNIPISIKEEAVDSIGTNVRIELPYNLDGEAMDDAAFNFNNDTTQACIPFWNPSCNIKIGSIHSLRLELSNGVSSKWITLKNKKANHLMVTVNIHGTLGSYLFLTNEKYLYRDGKLYPLPIIEVTEYDMRSGKEVKREVVLEKANR